MHTHTRRGRRRKGQKKKALAVTATCMQAQLLLPLAVAAHSFDSGRRRSLKAAEALLVWPPTVNTSMQLNVAQITKTFVLPKVQKHIIYT